MHLVNVALLGMLAGFVTTVAAGAMFFIWENKKPIHLVLSTDEKDKQAKYTRRVFMCIWTTASTGYFLAFWKFWQ